VAEPAAASGSHRCRGPFFLERNRLWGRGIGYIDVHLLASLSQQAGARLWTRDTRLRETAEQLGLAHPEPDA